MKFLTKCLEEIENGLTEIEPDDELAERHIYKARHNLRAADKLIADSDRFLEDNDVDPDSLVDMKTLPHAIDENTELLFYDWAIISSYYAIYHTILALLISIGYSSKNHSCAIASLEHFFQRKKQRLGDREILVIKHIKAIGRDMVEEAWTMKDRRERTAYGVALSTERFDANQSLEEARSFLNVAMNILDEIRKTLAEERIRKGR
ncbi:MAG: HEPN domain-containing protein [Candidatus Hydrothermarchaeales archaeon]